MYRANATALGDLTKATRRAGTMLVSAADKVHDSVYELDWQGQGKKSAEGRADRELHQDRTLDAGYQALAEAYEQGCRTMQPMIDGLRSQGQGLEADSFAVSEDWKVTDTFNYQAGKAVMIYAGASEEEATQRMNDLSALRGQEAATATTTLQRLADELGNADQDTMNAINQAKDAIAAAAPPVAGLGLAPK